MSHRITTIQLSLFIVLCASFGMAPDAYAVTRTWDGEGGDNNWSTGANWSGNVAPTGSDDVVFNGTSTKDAIWDSSATASILSFSLTSAYTGVLSITKAGTLSIGAGGWSYAGSDTSKFSAGSSTLSFNGVVSFTAGGATYNSLSYTTGGSSNFTTSGTANISGNLTLTGVGGTGRIVGSSTLNVSGNVSCTNFAVGTDPEGTIVITGSAHQSFTATTSCNLNNLTVNKSLGVLSLSGTVAVDSAFTYSDGRIDAGTSTIAVGGNGTFSGGSSQVYYGISFDSGSSATQTVSGTSTVTNVTFSGVRGTQVNGGTLNVLGNVTTTAGGSGNPGTLILVLAGSGDQTLSSTNGYLNNVTVNKSGGVLTMSGTVNLYGNWIWTQGALNAGTSTLNFVGHQVTGSFTPGNVTYYILKFSRTSASTHTTTLNGHGYTQYMTCTGGAGLQALAGFSISVYRDYDNPSSTTGCVGTTVLTFAGGGDQLVSGAGTGYMPSVSINKPSGTLTLSGTIIINGGSSWTHTAGKVDAGTSTIQFESTAILNPGTMSYYNVTFNNINSNGTATITGGAKVLNNFTAAGNGTQGPSTSGNSYTFDIKNFIFSTCGSVNLSNSLIKVSGNFSRTGACGFTANNSTVLLTGTNQTITGSTTFYNLYKILPPETTDTLTFAASSTSTIAAGGTARFMGTRGYPLSLRSSTPTTQYTITKTGSAVVEYADIQDAVISGATSAVASTNSGNNGVNWTFTREFVSTIRASGGDYTTLSGWESAIQADLTAATTKVFNHGGITGSIPDNSSVSGATSGATGTAVHVTSTQILIKTITGTFQSGEQIRLDVSNYVTSSDAGTGAIATAECYNDWRTGLNDSVTLSGWTTDADNFIIVVAPPSQSHRGKLTDTGGGYYRGFTLNPSAQVVPYTSIQSYTRTIGIAVDGVGGFTADNFQLLGFPDLVRGCLSANATRYGFLFNNHNAVSINNIAHSNASTGIVFNAGDDVKSYNDTVVGNLGFGIASSGPRTIIRNALASGNSSGDLSASGLTPTVATSASSDSTADDWGGTGNRVSQTFSFKDATNKDFHLVSSDTAAYGFGTDLSYDSSYPFRSDIDGDTRPGRNIKNANDTGWDIGADESIGQATRF